MVLAYLMAMVCLGVQAKKYRFDMEHPYRLEQVGASRHPGCKLVKVWGVAGNADKAIERALQDAVAACIFEGLPEKPAAQAGESIGATYPLCREGRGAYEAHKEWFDKFFKEGGFMDYVSNVNSSYPSGENNVGVEGGRKVGIYAEVAYAALRKLLEAEGIARKMGINIQ